jgi:NAD(P)-dependent dehydrogenase (short-subunit alcohol dehydrogenase family)
MSPGVDGVLDVVLEPTRAPSMGGLVAVVTGGRSRIGRACVRALLAEGARVGVLDTDAAPRTDQDTLPLTVDPADTAALRAALAAVVAEFGGIDVLVNCSGIGAAAPLGQGDARVSRVALPYLQRRRGGAIVNISSVAAWTGAPHRIVFAASQRAVHSLTQAMASDLADTGVRVNCVCPGTVDTAVAGRLLDDGDAVRGWRAGPADHDRPVTPEEVAAAMCYLASPAAGATTGAALVLDGGIYVEPG